MNQQRSSGGHEKSWEGPLVLPELRSPTGATRRSSPIFAHQTDPHSQDDLGTPLGHRVRLEPLTPVVLEDYLAALANPEVNRLIDNRAMFDRPTIETGLATRQEHHDRADWAAVRAADGAFLGEAVLNEFDPDNESASYRVWLAGPHLFGQGYVICTASTPVRDVGSAG
jgi:RimJ/RimL family protein N-acetyltransferase